MNTNELRNYVNKHLLPFVQAYNSHFMRDVGTEGFSFICFDSSLRMAVNFRKIMGAKGFMFDTNGQSIILKSVEKKMIDFLQEIGFEIENKYDTLRSIPKLQEENVLAMKRSISSIEILTEDDFIELSRQIKVYFSSIIFPYFNKYSSMLGISEAINEMTLEEMLTYIGGNFPIQFYKAMYITYQAENFTRYEAIKKGVPEWFEDARTDENYTAKVPLYEKGFHELIKMLEESSTCK